MTIPEYIIAFSEMISVRQNQLTKNDTLIFCDTHTAALNFLHTTITFPEI